jgi:hypothetical protein
MKKDVLTSQAHPARQGVLDNSFPIARVWVLLQLRTEMSNGFVLD